MGSLATSKMGTKSFMQSSIRRPGTEMTVRMNETEAIQPFSLMGKKIPDETHSFDDREERKWSLQ